MNRRRTLLATAGLLIVPGMTLAFFNRPYCPPVHWVGHPVPVYVLPVDPCVCPAPIPARLADCPPAMNPPPTPLNPPKVMEKTEAPQPKTVSPAAAAEPMPDKPKVEKVEPPKGELAIPSPAVPETPVEKPKPKTPEPAPVPAPAPLTMPPIDVTPAKPKKDEPPKELTPKIDLTLPKKEEPPKELAPKIDLTLPKVDVPSPKVETPPKQDIPTLILPVTGEQPPKKLDIPTLPPLTLPNVSESKYTPVDAPKVRVIPVEGRRSAGNQTVSLYNYTDHPLELQIDGKATQVPAKSLVSLSLPDSFAWKLGEKSETATIPSDAAGLSIVIQ
ncbi:hypothetical protein [Limnoglobus roseus]|uniref:Filamentous hemagglutinin n=1 Tax=Limnoglobus roseus TaxID=2598579 RepID=A0A5C1APU8_9BACT|nr:hypothetical protein [Limnoglobus roseus]QEL20046.1 Filamentous hemagglutinin [Limnoglobus roseus]